MPHYTFMDYAPGGRSVIADWLNEYRENIRVQIHSGLVAIIHRAWAVEDLTLPRFEKLKGAHRDLIAVRLERDKVQYRVFACAGVGLPLARVWLLAGGTESNNRYRPTGALETALARRAAIIGNPNLVRPTCLLEETS